MQLTIYVRLIYCYLNYVSGRELCCFRALIRLANQYPDVRLGNGHLTRGKTSPPKIMKGTVPESVAMGRWSNW